MTCPQESLYSCATFSSLGRDDGFRALEAVQFIFDAALQVLGTGACRPRAGEAVVNKDWLQNSD
jgi:hypothetical protein